MHLTITQSKGLMIIGRCFDNDLSMADDWRLNFAWMSWSAMLGLPMFFYILCRLLNAGTEMDRDSDWQCLFISSH
jgi:hypothetical protein